MPPVWVLSHTTVYPYPNYTPPGFGVNSLATVRLKE